MNPTLPRVTEIIRAVGLGKDFSQIDPFYRDRGTATHMAINMYLNGTLDESTIDLSYKDHFAGFLKFWKDYGCDKFSSEQHVENKDYQGTIDLVMKGKLWDFKCSKSHDKVAEIQGAGYKNLLDNLEPFIVVQFPGDGSYKLIEYEAPVSLWDATWRLYRWKKG